MYFTWQMQQFLQLKIQPRKSFLRFILLLVISMAFVFFIIFLIGLTIIHFKEFFFTP